MTAHSCGDGGSMGYRDPTCTACQQQPDTPRTAAEGLREALQAIRNRLHNLDPERKDPGLTTAISIVDEEGRAALARHESGSE